MRRITKILLATLLLVTPFWDAHPAGAGVATLRSAAAPLGPNSVEAFGQVSTYPGGTGTAPMRGIAATPDGDGYWLVGSDGGIFTFGDATYQGSASGQNPSEPAVAVATHGTSYWIAFGRSPAPGIAGYAAARQSNLTVEVDDLLNGEIFVFRPGVSENTASTVKVDILVALMAEAQSQNRQLTSEERSEAVPMIEDSSDTAANDLWDEVGPARVAALEKAVGMTSTVLPGNGVWGKTTTTTADRIALMRAVVFHNAVLTDASRSYMLNLMEHINPTQDWGATGGVPAGVSVALKNGFAPIIGWQINDEGWVDGDGRDYLIAMLSNENPSEAYGIQTLNEVSSIVWKDLSA